MPKADDVLAPADRTNADKSILGSGNVGVDRGVVAPASLEHLQTIEAKADVGDVGRRAEENQRTEIWCGDGVLLKYVLNLLRRSVADVPDASGLEEFKDET